MHSEVQTAAVAIISYKPLFDLNFLGTQDSMQLYALSPFGVYKTLVV